MDFLTEYEDPWLLPSPPSHKESNNEISVGSILCKERPLSYPVWCAGIPRLPAARLITCIGHEKKCITVSDLCTPAHVTC